jgi:DNA (cytosine-5)-methyltransferase 1
LISPVLTYAQHGGANRDVREPHHTICANLKDQNSVIVPALVRHFGKSVGQDIGFPAPTTTAGGGGKTALLAPLIAQQNTARSGVNPGRAADTPFSTLTGSGSQQNVIAPYFAKYYGTGDGARADDPCHTITVKDRFSHVQAQLAAPEFTSDMEYAAYRVARFLEAHGAWDDRRFVTLTIGGTEYVVVDIGLRMLTPRELFNAQGFPPDYVIDGVWKEDGDNWTFKPFTKSTQVSCCGNSVCPDLAAALVRSNCAHLIEERKAA